MVMVMMQWTCTTMFPIMQCDDARHMMMMMVMMLINIRRSYQEALCTLKGALNVYKRFNNS